MRVLEYGTKEVENNTVETIHAGMGYRMVMRGGDIVCDDGPSTHARASSFLIECGDLNGKSLAWIGGGMGVGPLTFAYTGCTQSVYEILECLREYCPPGVTFIPGDWRATITGLYDIIIFDLGVDVPYAELQPHLNPGGRVLPEADGVGLKT